MPDNQSPKKKRFFSKSIGFLLAATLLLPFFISGPNPIEPARVPAPLLAMAADQPDTTVAIIVQKATQDSAAEAVVAELGGVITKDLHIINGFAAELPAQAAVELAQDSSVDWVSLDAPMIQDSGADDPLTISLRSEFNQATYDDGRSSAWTEIGENDGPELGSVAITNFLGGALTGLRIQDAEKGIQSQFDLTEAESAVLSFGFRRKGFESESDYIAVEISNDGGSSWAELDRLAGPATDPNLMFASYDLAPFIGSPFALRFISSASLPVEGKFYIDYVKIEYQAAVSERETIELAYQVMLPIVMTPGDASAANMPTLDAPMYTTDMEIIRDSFNAISYNNNDGTVYWRDSWTEYDPDGDDEGASGGYVYVRNGRLTFDWAYNEHIIRHADLSNHDNAILTFDWQTSSLDSGEAISILVSQDGSNFTELAAFGGSQSGSAQYDISSYISNNTTIKFANTGQYWEFREYAYIDNVQIDLSTIAAGPAVRTARDEFSVIDWGNNDGTENWSDTWHGYNRGGGSPSIGNLYISDGRLYFHYAYVNSEYAYRTANLTGSTQAILTFDWQTIGLDYGETISVLVSEDDDNFVELGQFGGSQSGVASYDISAYISDNTTIHIENKSSDWESGEYAIFDNIQIAHSCVECVDTTNLDSAYVQAIRADQVWNEAPYLQGQGVTVAIVDSGIANHIDLTDEAGNSRILTHVQFMTDDSLPDDLYGHGTHIAGSIAGNGLQSNGIYMGVAPKANLVDVKVIDDHGAGYTSDVVAGIQWIYENHETYNIRIVNLSLNSAVIDSYHESPLDAALEILWFNGITVVVSAGNNGDDPDGYLYAPANDPFFITVGATNDMGTVDISDDILASFSAHGTTQEGFQKPDVLAPGVDIISLLASDDSNLILEHPDHAVVGPDGNYYFRMSGTSMSSAVASGVVALLLQDEPDLNPDQVKYRLMATGSYFATPVPGPMSVAYLDVPAAIHSTTTETANTGIPASEILWSGDDPINWGSVNWGSVNWGSVNWGSVNWGSVNWGSVNWGSVNWGD